MIELVEKQMVEAKKLDDAALVIVDKVAAMTVTDQRSKDGAVLYGQHIVTEIGVRKDFFKPMKDAAFASHKKICDTEREKITRLQGAKDALGKKITDWSDEQDRLAEEAREKAEAEQKARDEERRKKEAAEAAERDRKLKEAEEAEAAKKKKEAAAEAAKRKGDEEAAAKLKREAEAEGERADTLIDEAAASEAAEPEPEPEPIQPKVAAPAKTKGGVSRKAYSADVYDEIALIKAVAAGDAPRRCVAIDRGYLNKLATMDKEDINKIAGVRLKTESKQGFRKLT